MTLGANARSGDVERRALLAGLGFVDAFAMVEMEAPAGLPAAPPSGSDVRLRPAGTEDAAAIAGLTTSVWSGRKYFTPRSLEDVRHSLARADLDLYLLAPHAAEIDDVQVHPGRRRRGVATALLVELARRVGERTTAPLRLFTEAHDPAGTRSLYERLGFRVTETHLRLRREL